MALYASDVTAEVAGKASAAARGASCRRNQGTAMRIPFAACLALSLAVSLAGQTAQAAEARKHKKQYSSGQNGSAAYRDRQRRGSGDPNATPDWYPHDSSQLPVGSKRWWEQKERESGGSSRD